MPSMEYSELFTNYTSKSNGKRLVANAVLDIMEANNLRVVLDMGAGNGELTRYLMPHAKYLVAAEPNAKFSRDLASLGTGDRYRYVQSSIEDFAWENGKFDLILLAYVLESMGGREKWASACQKLQSLLSAHGMLLGATYVDGCAWDTYATIVEKEIGLDSRSGGLSRVFPSLRNAGFNVQVRSILTTQIWGDDIDQLYDGLAFFFRRKADAYYSKRNFLLPSLRRVSSPFGSEVSIAVKEVIYEIVEFPGR